MRVENMTGPVQPNIGIHSYSSRKGVVPTAQWEFDVSAFRDPMGQKQFQGKNGNIPEIVTWVCQDKRVPAVLDLCAILAEDLLRPHMVNGANKSICSWVSIAFKDTHGTMIAPAVAEAVADKLSNMGFIVAVSHHALPSAVKK